MKKFLAFVMAASMALAPEGERCPEGAEGENLAIARNISGNRTVLFF